MNLQKEISNCKREIQTDGYPISIGEIISIYQSEEIDIHPEFQRIYRWTDYQRTKFIESILLGIPIPPIFVSQREDGVWDVVDGVQRLSTIFQFVGVLKDEDEKLVEPLKLFKTEYLPSLENKVWKDDNEEISFTNGQRLDFKREKLFFQIIKKESDPNAKYDLFQRLNTLGSRLTDQEIRNCILVMINLNFYEWLDKISKYNSFMNCISLSDRLEDERYDMELALRFLVFKNATTEEIRGGFDIGKFILEKMQIIANDRRYNFAMEEEIFKNTFDLLNRVLGQDVFRRYEKETDRFLGKFLVSAFEAIAIGVGSNIYKWTSITHNVDESICSKVKSIWGNDDFRHNIGAGIGSPRRISMIIPLGKRIFIP